MFASVRRLIALRDLVFYYTLRQVSKIYKGSSFGFIWAVLQPLMTLGVYAIVWGVLFPRHTVGDSRWGHIPLLFAGLLPYQLFREVVGGAPALLKTRGAMLRKLVFPVEVLPMCQTAAAVFHNLIGWVICIVISWIAFGTLRPTASLVPVALLPLVLICVGMSWLFASLGIFLGDLRNLVNVALHLGFFLTPVIYPLSRVPAKYQPLFLLNPICAVIELCRAAIIPGVPFHWGPWFVALAIGLGQAAFGLWVINRLKGRFADVA